MNKSGIECIITGCELCVPAQMKWCHGDLHMVGTCFVFNAVLHPSMEGYGDGGRNEADWTGPAPGSNILHLAEDATNCFVILDQPFYFERRGVIVFDALHSHFNQAAKDYLLPQLKESIREEDNTSAAIFARFLRSSRR